MRCPTQPELAFAHRVREARLRRGLTQLDVAESGGLHVAAVSHFETGHRRPSLANLCKLARVLNVSTDYLLGLTNNPEARR